ETQPAIGLPELSYTYSDDFEDGVIDSSMWHTQGRKGGGRLGAGNWQYSFNEIKDDDGYLEARVWGPTSGTTYFGEASVRTTYNFNDGRSWLINFTWETSVGFSPAFDCFGIQITDGGFPKSSNSYWIWNGNPPGTNTLWYVKTGYYREKSESQFSKRTWSIKITPEGIASFYKSSDVLDSPYSQVTLDPSRQWYIRFVQVDATAGGLPAGDNTFKLYDFSAVCEPVNSQPSTI
nr:hypothetical protein [Phycisphaerae bacterium]